MRPIPAPRIGDSHGLLRAIDDRGRLRVDEFITEFAVDELFPPGLENALGRTRQFVSYARSAGLLNEDRGIVELTEIGKRYVRAGAPERVFDVAPGQAEWLRRQLREKHMTDSIFHGLAIGLSLLASNPPGTLISTLDFGRALAYLGRAGWDNENTLAIQGERHITLLRDLELIDGDRRLTPTGIQTKGDLTLPVHMSLADLAGQLNPGGPDAVRAEGEAEWGTGVEEPEAQLTPAAAPEPEPAPEPAPAAAEAEDEYRDVGRGAWSPAPSDVSPIDAPTVITRPTQPTPAPEPAEAPAPATPPAPAQAPAVAAEATPAAAASPTPPAEAPAPPVDVPSEAPAPAGEDGATAVAEPLVAPAPAFLDAAAIRAAAEAAGLVFPAAVYANVAAALAAGKHVVLTGPPGSGKTSLALAVAEAAARSGRSNGATLVAASARWSPKDTLGRPGADGGEAEPGLVVAAAKRGRWLVVDELDRARLDRALGPLSSFLGGLPVAMPGGGEVAPADGWRIVATWGDGPRAASAAMLRRFAYIELPAADPGALARPLEAAAGGDAAAAGAIRRLLTLRDLRPLGAGVFLDAARHAAARRAAEPADERTLAREAFRAYLEPLLAELDAEGERRVRELLDG